jgi:biotin carboxyl carrier protein
MGKYEVNIDGQLYLVDLQVVPGSGPVMKAVVNGHTVKVIVPDGRKPDAIDWLVVDDKPYEISFDPRRQRLHDQSGAHQVRIRSLEYDPDPPRSLNGQVSAPIPGCITHVLVQHGQTVISGQALLVLEAMKMENEIRSPKPGVVHSLCIQPGETVRRGQLLLEIE